MLLLLVVVLLLLVLLVVWWCWLCGGVGCTGGRWCWKVVVVLVLVV